MRQLAFAASFLAMAAVTTAASATSPPLDHCVKPVVGDHFPKDGMTGVPIDAIGRVWFNFEEISCSAPSHRYTLRFGETRGPDLGNAPYADIASEPDLLPPNSEVELSLLEDEVRVFRVKFTTGSEAAAPPVAPTEVELVSITFEPTGDAPDQYHALARVRFKPPTTDPLASGVVEAVGSALGVIHAGATGEDGFYDMTFGALALSGTPLCIHAGMENAAGQLAFGDAICTDPPPPAVSSGCSVGGGSDSRGGALLALLVGLASAARAVRRPRTGARRS